MPLTKTGKAVRRKFQKRYGKKAGKSAFYATMNAHPKFKKAMEKKH